MTNEAPSPFNLQNLQNSMVGLCSPKECEKYFNTWIELRKKGEGILKGLDPYLKDHQGMMQETFPPLVAAIEWWFSPAVAKQERANYKEITKIILPLYDLLLSLRRAYFSKSAMSCSLVTRSILEARINLLELSQDLVTNLPKYEDYLEVERLWYEYKEGALTQDEVKLKLKKFPVWYDEDWKTLKKKIKFWTGFKDESLAKMAERNGLKSDYESLYRNTSKFAHFSPILSNYYTLQSRGPVSSDEGILPMAVLGINQFIEAYGICTQIIGLKDEEVIATLKIPIVILSSHR